MPCVRFTAPVMAGTGKIWSTLSAFGHIADWHPDIRCSRIENGCPETTPGAVRRLDMQDSSIIKEELLTLDPESMTLSYRFTHSPLPWDNYTCIIQVVEHENSDSVIESYVTWSASFDVQVLGTEAENEVQLREMIMTSYNGLRAFIELSGGTTPGR